MSFLETSYKGTKRKNKDAVFEIIDSECCPLDCLKRLPFNDIEGVRSEFTSLETIADERNYILNYLKDNTSITYKTDKEYNSLQNKGNRCLHASLDQSQWHKTAEI